MTNGTTALEMGYAVSADAQSSGRVSFDAELVPLAAIGKSGLAYEQAMAGEGRPENAVADRAAQIRSRALRGRELEALPAPSYLVDGVLPARALSVMYGPSGYGKSHLALDIAIHIVCGFTWCGRSVLQGPVWYISAEGASGQQARQGAQFRRHGLEDLQALTWYPDAINLLSRVDVDALIQVLGDEPRRPVLVIFDTQARCTPGAEENGSTDMGRMIEACDRIVAEAETAVQLVHHSGTDISRGLRGHTSQDGAMAAILSVQRTADGTIRLKVAKMKDGPEDAAHRFRLEPVANSVLPVEVGAPNDGLEPELVSMLAVLEELDDGGGVASGDWEATSGVPHTSFHRRRKLLVGANLCSQGGTDRKPRYTLTDKGKGALGRTQVPPGSSRFQR